MTAERAVSPAESVQTLDGPEFNELLNWLFETHGTPWAFSEHRKRFITHIDASRAAAHAEGRRSALEELHPQWLKEKERADRLEAKIPCTLGVGTGGGSLFVHGTYEAIKATQEWVLRAERAEAALAARQAPDIDHLPCYKLTDGSLTPIGIVKTIIDRGDIMLSLLDVRTALLSSTAQPLQQEGGKDAPSQEWLSKLEYIFRRIDHFRLCMSYNDSYFGEPAGLLKGCVAEMAHLFDGYHRLASSQPSDNLQQASTAQAEDRRHHEEPDGPNHPGHHDGHTCEAMGQMLADFGSQRTTPEAVVAGMNAKMAANNAPTPPRFVAATGLHELRDELRAAAIFSEPITLSAESTMALVRYMNAVTTQAEPAKRYVYETDDIRLESDKPFSEKEIMNALRKAEAQAMPEQGSNDWWDEVTHGRTGSAKATPEGADLPPLPHTTYNGYSDGSEPLYTTDQMREYARAAITATTAADPVAWLIECIKGDRRGQFELSEPNEKASNPDYWSDAFPVYRAAPPQQVDTKGDAI